MMSLPSLHVVIIGGGIGGLCLAQGLKAAGINVDVYERDSAASWLEGFRIHINPIGSRALHACLPPVLWEAFVATAGMPPAGLGFLTEQLQKLVVIADESMSSQAGNPTEAHYPVSRIALRHLLLAGLEDVVHYDKTFERYENTSEGKVTACFSDGTSATGNLLVGADGANSRVRQQYLPQARRVEIGTMGVGGKVLLTDQVRSWLPHPLTKRLNLFIPLDRYCLFSAPFDRAHISPEALNKVQESAKVAGLNPELLVDNAQDYLLFGFFAHNSEFPANMEDLDKEDLVRLIDQMMKHWHPDLRRLIAESDRGNLRPTRFKASTLIDPWESTNVTLLGDSIHNMPPVGGLGGNMALRDAWALSQTLTGVQRRASSLLPAIQDYEKGMRTQGYAAVRSALRYTRLMSTNNRLERFGIRTWFRTCDVIPPLKRVFEDQWTRPMRNELQPAHAN